jgi:phosphoserine aminotransferase
MTKEIYNFSAGPAMIPKEVLLQAQEEMLSLPYLGEGIGMSVMEISHRSDVFTEINRSAQNGIRELLNIPNNYQVLFLQGGASLQFSMIPMNFLGKREIADYIVTGAWGEKAILEAQRCGNAREIYTTKETGYKSVPAQEALRFTTDAKFIHYTSNETIEGVEFKYDLDGEGIPVICDASSNILSKPIDVSKYAMIYAGAQKNIGPSGVTLVIIRDDLLEKVPENQHSMLNYRKFADNQSMLNTPNTWGIYLVDLVCKWLKKNGGVENIEKKNIAKSKVLYDAIDKSDGYFNGHADLDARSLMNVTFRLPNTDLETKFIDEAMANGFDGLKGHRSVGGIRASIYNAFPIEGVAKLTEFMTNFSTEYPS